MDKELLIRMENYARKMLDFSENFIHLAKTEGPEEALFYDVDLVNIVCNAMDQVWTQATEKNITLTQRFEIAEAWLKGDGQLLERAIINLLTNAIKYSPKFSEITLQVGKTETEYFCCVLDNGFGISEEYLPNIFDRFSRDNTSNTGNIHGFGLGLAFVKAVAQRHHGQIEVASKVGMGSSFCLRLPFSHSDD